VSALVALRQIITEPQELYRFLVTPGIEITTLLFAGDCVLVTWRHASEADVPILRHTNDVIGNYVTAGALYSDTASVLYILPRDGAALVTTVDCLGAMTSEPQSDIHIAVRVRRPKKLHVQIVQYGDRCFNDRLQSAGFHFEL
jgi:hypothetical protein